MIWRFQPRVAALLQNPHPFPEYTGIHIRRGDKVFGGQKEADLVEAKIYYEAIKQYADWPCTIVIASDDQHSVSEFRKECKEYRIISLCPKIEAAISSRTIIDWVPKTSIWKHF